jgi:multidrug efflux pump subunit AcrA (membrane-fusion protein)
MKNLKKNILLIFAFLGFLFGFFMIFYSTKEPKKAKILFAPAIPSFKHYVAGIGIIEAISDNIEIGTPFPEIVDKVYVRTSQKVKKNDPIYKLNTQSLEAQRNEYIQQKEVTKKKLEDTLVQFSFYERLLDKKAVSESEYKQKYYEVEISKKQLDELQAKIDVVNTNIERSIIKAPFDGTILDINLRISENAQSNPFQKPWLILFGNIDEYHIRIDIDESDIWRIYKNANATAYVRGNSSIQIPLEFQYIEPYVGAKKNLSSDNQERVDTRVLQIVYKFKKNSYPVYVGQILDVYIEALPLNYEYPYEKKNYN